MSAVPPPYYPETSFATQAQQPIVVAGLPGSKMDTEFVNIKNTVNQIRARLSQIQRDDGKLVNGIVNFQAIDPGILQMLAGDNANLRGLWAPNTTYNFTDGTADVFVHQGQTRICLNTYTSAADYGALDEANTGVLGSPPSVGTIIRDVFAGNGTNKVFTMTADPISTTNVHVYVNGLNKLAGVDFTLAAKVITFATAPANAAVIVTEVGVVNEIDITTVGDGTITTDKLANVAVTTGKIADLAVTGAKVADGSITNSKLGTASVNAGKIEDGSVTNSKLAINSITGDKIQDGSISSGDIANGAISTDKIATGAVNAGTIADNSITTVKVADANITTPKILDGSVTTPKIADTAITAPKLATGIVGPTHLTGAQTGTAPIFGVRAWAVVNTNLTTANKTGTYSQTGTTVTAAVTAHGLLVGHTLYAAFTSGTATSGTFVVATVVDANNFTFTRTSATTSGAVTLQFSTIVKAGNVSSVAKVAAGDVVVNFTTPMPDANYSVIGGAFGPTGGIGSVNVKATTMAGTATLKTTSSCELLTYWSTSGNIDFTEIYVNFIG